MSIVAGEKSFHLENPGVSLAVTARGGHLAPVVFHLPGRDVSPYSISPWEPEEFPDLPPLLSVLRGDFFCLPFGPQADGPPHGETANGEWLLEASDERQLHLSMTAGDSGARVEKILGVRDGEHAVYCEHRISGISGKFSYGNHPILDLSDLPDGSGRISISPFRWASVYPGVFSDPANGESQALTPGTTFDDFSKVPLAAGGFTDLSRYPSRAGNDDLVMLVNVPATTEQPFAWSAVVMDGYVWFSLKNPADFPVTMFWFSNGGRSAAPWLGRHVGRVGVEEVCSYFAEGAECSRRDPLRDLNIPTTRNFMPHETVSLRVIQAAALVPEDFGSVSSIVPDGESFVLVTSKQGHRIRSRVDWTFVL